MTTDPAKRPDAGSSDSSTAVLPTGRDIARLLRICTTPLHDLHNLLIEAAEEIERLRSLVAEQADIIDYCGGPPVPYTPRGRVSR